jgi:hydroxymethylpyrimidine pyrophosphatase-like HAD family hydrolase
MNIKMIVTDFDGTILKKDTTVSARVKDVLLRCRQKGIKLVYATGRGNAHLVVDNTLFDAHITFNGAIARINDEVVYNKTIPSE